jgi:hypothetical protein
MMHVKKNLSFNMLILSCMFKYFYLLSCFIIIFLYYLLIIEPKYLFINIIGYCLYSNIMSYTHSTQDLVVPTNIVCQVLIW